MRTRFLPLSLHLATAGLLAGSAAAQASFTIMGSGSAGAMNSDGTAVVGRDPQGAFLWTATGGYQPLGQTDAVGVSEDATVVLGNMVDMAGMDAAGRWTASTGWVSLGGVGSSSGSSLSSAYGMSGDGNRATGLGWLNAARGVAFDWTPLGGMQPLPALGPNSTRGNCVSLDGSTIGGWDEDTTGPRRAKIWGVGGTELLILVNPTTNLEGIGEVFGLSSDGTWACGIELSDAFVWSQATGVINFGPLPNWVGGFFDNGYSMAVSDDGSRVVGWYGSFFNSAATLWSPTGGYQRLADVLTAAGVNLMGYDITRAVDISADGRVILGEARPAGSFLTEWFIATLDGPIGTPYCAPAVANSTGIGATLSAIGNPVAANNNVTLEVGGLPQNSNAYFITSMVTANTPNAGGSQGTLCLGGTIGRYSMQVQNSGATGSVSLALDLNNIPQPLGAVAVAAGETWNFQLWYRDANPQSTSNFSTAVGITFQ